MSIADQITRIKNQRNVFLGKLVEMGVCTPVWSKQSLKSIVPKFGIDGEYGAYGVSAELTNGTSGYVAQFFAQDGIDTNERKFEITNVFYGAVKVEVTGKSSYSTAWEASITIGNKTYDVQNIIDNGGFVMGVLNGETIKFNIIPDYDSTYSVNFNVYVATNMSDTNIVGGAIPVTITSQMVETNVYSADEFQHEAYEGDVLNGNYYSYEGGILGKGEFGFDIWIEDWAGPGSGINFQGLEGKKIRITVLGYEGLNSSWRFTHNGTDLGLKREVGSSVIVNCTTDIVLNLEGCDSGGMVIRFEEVSDAVIGKCAAVAKRIPVFTSPDSGVILDDIGTHMDVDVIPGYHKSYATIQVEYPTNDAQIAALEAQVDRLEDELAAAETELTNL